MGIALWGCGSDGPATSDGGSGGMGGTGGTVQKEIEVRSPLAEQAVCSATVRIRVTFSSSFDLSSYTVDATLTQDPDSGSPSVEDISDLFVVSQEAHQALADVAVPSLGPYLLTFDSIEVAFERLDYGDPDCPSCEDLLILDADLDAAVDAVINDYSDPWGSLVPIGDDVARDLGCELTDPTALRTVPKADECAPNCRTEYCDDVSYCGRGNSQRGNATMPLPGSSCLNKACRVHDLCYENDCIRPNCLFSTQADLANGCDQSILQQCNDPSCSTSIKEKLVCKVAKNLKDEADPEECGQQPCSGTSLCCQIAGHQDELNERLRACDGGCQVYDPDGDPTGTRICPPCFPGCGHRLNCTNAANICSLGECVGSNPGELCQTCE